jgi:hypothetical protein
VTEVDVEVERAARALLGAQFPTTTSWLAAALPAPRTAGSSIR